MVTGSHDPRVVKNGGLLLAVQPPHPQSVPQVVQRTAGCLHKWVCPQITLSPIRAGDGVIWVHAKWQGPFKEHFLMFDMAVGRGPDAPNWMGIWRVIHSQLETWPIRASIPGLPPSHAKCAV